MIDADTRRRLSLNVRRLVTGRMTNDTFDDVYCDSYARTQFQMTDSAWKQYDFELRASATDTMARFAFWFDQPGTLWVDQVVLMPGSEELYNNLPLRRDYVDTGEVKGQGRLLWLCSRHLFRG